MNAKIEKMFTDAEGRYLEAGEIKMLTSYADGLPRRLGVMKLVERHEDDILTEVVETVSREHPELIRKYDQFDEYARRDVSKVLRYCAIAMVRNDMSFLEENLLYWLRTILHSFFSLKILDTTYRSLAQSVERKIGSERTELIAPYLRRTHEVLTTR
jgi:hypothetical protein